MKRTGIGHGKLILFGEHAAVYGHPAVGTPLPVRTVLNWHPDPSEGQTDAADGPSESDAAVFRQLLDDLTVLRPGDEFLSRGFWKIREGVHRCGGFGSSAALCTALARIALDDGGTDYSTEVHLLANLLERRFHGTPSGIDTGMSADTGCAAWYSGGGGTVPDRVPLVLPEWHLICGALPRRGSTAAAVAGIRRKRDGGDLQVRACLDELGKIAGEFIGLCEPDRGSGAGSFAADAAVLANRAQTALSRLGLSTPEMDRLIGLARDCGASGGKLSGGGLGGAFWLAASDRQSRDRILNDLMEMLSAEGTVMAVPLFPVDLGSRRVPAV